MRPATKKTHQSKTSDSHSSQKKALKIREKAQYYLLLFAFLILMALSLFLFRDFLNANSNSLMVLITFVYVVATVEICRANIRSADATREQLAESKRQFEDKKRLELMPYLEVLVCDDITDFHECIGLALSSQNAKNSTIIDRRISINNIGLGPAKDVRYTWRNLDGEYDRNDLGFTAILSGEAKNIYIDFYAEHKDDFSEYVAPVSIEFTYSDLLENKYRLRVDLAFTISTEKNVRLTKYTVGTPCFVKG